MEIEKRGRCKEFYDKWQREPNWCEKCDRSASYISSYIDLTHDYPHLKKYKESYFRRILPEKYKSLWKEFSNRVLIKEAELGHNLSIIDMSRIISTMLKRYSSTNMPPLPNDKFQTIVIDPPYPIQKILREVRPNQEKELDYPTMTIEDIKAFPLNDIASDNCHVYLWTTHKFLPTAFEIFRFWGVNYECLLTWVKNVGFTPFSWMYSTEHVLFGRIGSLELLQKGRRLDFEGKVRQHSRKPDSFYDLVREVSPAPRIDVFSREKREGFEQYGNEVEKFNDD